jgi:basic amino acid/polyamine antiporter, APA family
MTYLDTQTWIRFGVWLVIGLLIYPLYGYRNSRLRAAASPGGPASLR